MNSVSNNPYRGINTTTQNNIPNNIKPQINKIESTQQQVVENFVNKIKEEIEKAQLICIKIVKCEYVSKADLDFISKKYPDMKKLTENSLKDYDRIIKELKLCKNHEEIEKVLSKFSKETLPSSKNDYINQLQSKLKNTVLQEIIKFSEKIKFEIQKAENIALKMVKGEEISPKEESFLKQKYPNIKQIAEETVKYIDKLKLDLKGCNTESERQLLLDKEINYLESKKDTLTKTEIKLKDLGIQQVEKFLKDNKENIKKLQVIVLKIISDKSLNKSDEKFINKEYPNIKEVIIDERKNYQYLNELSKNDKNKEQVLFDTIKDIEYQIQNGRINEYQAMIKKIIIENMKRERKDSINYYMNLYSNMIFTTVTENKIAIITLIVIILAITYIL